MSNTTRKKPIRKERRIVENERRYYRKFSGAKARREFCNLTPCYV